MSAINCEDCIFRKRESDFENHCFTDYCHHPMSACLSPRQKSPAKLGGTVHALTPDHPDPPQYKRRPGWCPRAVGRKEAGMP